MSLIDDLDLQGASARQAQRLASPKTALVGLTPQQADTPGVEQLVRLAPGAAPPEQKPPPKSPGAKHYTTGAFGRVIPISLGQRRLEGTVIQSSALVPRLVGNREYEVTYEIPAVEDQVPEEELNEGDPVPKVPKTIWCSDCNCYYCYVGPLDVDIPFATDDKGTWPYMAMMGTWQSRLCTAWDYKRLIQFGDDDTYGALVDPGLSGSVDRWTYQPPPGTGLPNDPIVKLTCGPCAEEAPYPDSVAAYLETGNQTVSPAPHTHFVYFGYILATYEGAADPDAIGIRDTTNYAFYYAVQTELSIHVANLYNLNETGEAFDYHITDVKMFRIFYDARFADEDQGEQLPGNSEGAGDVFLLPGWRFYDEVESFTGEASVWTEAQAIPDLGYIGETDYWVPTGPGWREWVKDHGGWAPEDEPDDPPRYKMLEIRREDPDDPFSEFKTLPYWNSGMLLSELETPLHRPVDGECTSITDYSDI